MFKGETFLDAYADLAERFRPRRILEIGVYRGGGTVFLDRYFKPEMLVAVEYSPDRLPKLDRYVESRSLSRMSVYHGVDQKDVPHLTSILDRHFEDGLDLVVDDASHWYEETKASFETVMPYLRPGGWYVIEDWPWAHAAPWQERGNLWEDKPALSNLIFRDPGRSRVERKLDRPNRVRSRIDVSPTGQSGDTARRLSTGKLSDSPWTCNSVDMRPNPSPWKADVVQ
jgi:hypothetical protein